MRGVVIVGLRTVNSALSRAIPWPLGTGYAMFPDIEPSVAEEHSQSATSHNDQFRRVTQFATGKNYICKQIIVELDV